MTDHSRAFVPVASGYFQSPELFARGRTVDTGLLAEALVFYDRVLIHVDNPHQFADLISWLTQQGLKRADLLRLLRDGTIQIYNYAFTTNPYGDPSNRFIYGLYNFSDQVMVQPKSFVKRFLEFEKLRTCFSTVRQYERFCETAAEHVIEAKADNVGDAGILNAWQDFLNPRRNSLITTKLLKDMYGIKRRGKSPNVTVKVNSIKRSNDFEALLATLSKGNDFVLVRNTDQIGSGFYAVSWNIDWSLIPGLEGDKLVFGKTLPLSAAGIANNYIWSASSLNCDLYLPGSIDSLVGDKLYEAMNNVTRSQAKTLGLIRRLELRVAFPKLRHHVNRDKIDFDHVLRFRKHARKFRRFLKAEAEIDRDALAAYLDEASQASGFTNMRRRILPFLTTGVALSGTVGGALGSTKAPIIGGVANFLLSVGSRIGSTKWTPKIFGDWYGQEIAKLLKTQERNS